MNAAIHLTRSFPVPPEVLFAALVERASEWLGGAGVLEAGAPFEAAGPDGVERGTVRKLEAPAKLTLLFEGPPETRAMLVLGGGPAGSELQLIHSGFEDGDARDAHVPRWDERLDRLGAVVA